MAAIKTTFKDDTRRFVLASNDFSALAAKITSLYGLESFSVKFLDEDGDLLTISSTLELEDALRTTEPKTLKLLVAGTPVHTTSNASPAAAAEPQPAQVQPAQVQPQPSKQVEATLLDSIARNQRLQTAPTRELSPSERAKMLAATPRTGTSRVEPISVASRGHTASPTPSLPKHEPLASLSVRQLKALLARRGVPFADCVEKAELVARARAKGVTVSPAASPSVPPKPAPAQTARQSSSTEAKAEPKAESKANDGADAFPGPEELSALVEAFLTSEAVLADLEPALDGLFAGVASRQPIETLVAQLPASVVTHPAMTTLLPHLLGRPELLATVNAALLSLPPLVLGLAQSFKPAVLAFLRGPCAAATVAEHLRRMFQAGQTGEASASDSDTPSPLEELLSGLGGGFPGGFLNGLQGATPCGLPGLFAQFCPPSSSGGPSSSTKPPCRPRGCRRMPKPAAASSREEPAAAPVDPETAVHYGVICDGCGMAPITGPRYKSTVLRDFDLCGACEARGDKHPANHPMIKIKVPRRPCGPWRGRRCGRRSHPVFHAWKQAKAAAAAATAKSEEPSQPAAEQKAAPKQPQAEDAPARQEAAPEPEAEATPALAAAFLGDANLPDGSFVAPRATLVKSWRLRNTGTQAWSHPGEAAGEVRLVFVRGDREVSLNEEYPVPHVAAGEEAEVSAVLVTPSKAGTYSAYFQLADADRAVFGPRFWAQVEVTAPGTTNSKTEEPKAADPEGKVADEGFGDVVIEDETTERELAQLEPHSPPSLPVHSESEEWVAVKDVEADTKEERKESEEKEGEPDDADKFQYQAELEQLQAMGFPKNELVTFLLKEHQGNVTEVCRILVAQLRS